jgi:PST family polysaccharide transporter
VSLRGSSFLNLASTRSIDLIVGFFLGPAAVGYLRVASKLNDFIVQFMVTPIINVALVSFAKVQDDKESLARMYRRLTQFCGLLTFPAFMGLAVLAPDVTRLVFGEKWIMSGQLMQILCFGSLASTLNYFFKPLMTAIGQQHRLFRITLVQLLLTVVAVAAGSQWSLQAVMVGYVAVSLTVMAINLLQIRQLVGVTLVSTGQAFLPPVVSSCVMAASVLLLHPVLSALPWVGGLTTVTVILQIMAGGLIYGGMLYLVFPAYARDVKEKLLPVILSSLKKKKQTPA